MHYIAQAIAKSIREDFANECDSLMEAGIEAHPTIRARSQYAARVAADGLSSVLEGFDRIEFFAECGV